MRRRLAAAAVYAEYAIIATPVIILDGAGGDAHRHHLIGAAVTVNDQIPGKAALGGQVVCEATAVAREQAAAPGPVATGHRVTAEAEGQCRVSGRVFLAAILQGQGEGLGLGSLG